jgi:RsmE family RNA methyltransferase
LKLDYTKKVNIFIWPEWWFSDREVIQFEKSNFTKVFLGNRILRTETAPIVAWFYIIQNY